jgi:hypothetical protein
VPVVTEVRRQRKPSTILLLGAGLAGLAMLATTRRSSVSLDGLVKPR